jgi:hypothetical protein
VDSGKTEYQHTDSGIPDTQTMWLLLNNFSLIDERDSCTFFLLFRHFQQKLHYIQVLQPPYLSAGHKKYQLQHNDIPDTKTMWLLLSIFLMTFERDPSTFYTLSGYFGHKLHYIIKVLQPPYKWTQEKQNINTHTVAFQTHKLCGSS